MTEPQIDLGQAELEELREAVVVRKDVYIVGADDVVLSTLIDMAARLAQAEESLAKEARLRIKDCEDRNAYKHRADKAEDG